MPLIVTGSVGIDSVEAPTGSAEDVLGGSSSYFAAAASFFGPVRLVGAVGEDFPEPFHKTLKHFGVDMAGLERRRGSKTFCWSGKYMDNMNVRETLHVEMNVLAETLPPVPVQYQDSKYIFLANTDPQSQLDLLGQFPNRALAVADTMDLWITTQREKLLELLLAVDGLVLNDAEAVLLTSKSNLVRAAESILDLGPTFVVIKKGEHGALLTDGSCCTALPAYPAGNVIDPTGAGDAFGGGMMGYLAATGDLSAPRLRTAIGYGTILASFTIESFSLDRLGQINRKDIERRFKEYQKMLRLEG